MNSKRFRFIMTALDLTQDEMAKLLGKSLRAVHGYANGGKIPRITAIILNLLVQNKITRSDIEESQ